MFAWILVAALAVMILGMLAMDVSPRDVFSAGWHRVRGWVAAWRASRK